VAKDQYGPIQVPDHIGHGKGFSRAGHPQQGLEGIARLKAFHQLPDRFRLVAGGLKI